MDGKAPGPQPLTLADWPFGSAARRGLLEVALLHPTPPAGWTLRELESRAGVGHGGLRHTLAGAQALGLLERDTDGRWHPPAHENDLAAPLRTILRALGPSHSDPRIETQSETRETGGKRARRQAAILRHLASGPTHISDLCTLTSASRATVYRELRTLRDAGSITLTRGEARRAA